MIARWRLAALTVVLGGLAVAGPASGGTLMSTDVPRALFDCVGPPGECSPAQINSTLTVPAGYGTITDIDVVGLKLSHTRTSDVEIKLMSPIGTVITLLSRECADENLVMADTLVFDQGASTEVGSTCPLGAGAYRPSPGNLDHLDVESAEGTWTLIVSDYDSPESGTLHAWGLRITVPGQTYTVTNTNDSGAGSLRQAITDANTNGARDRIEFEIPGAGPHTIAPPTDLPWVTDSAVVDARTEQGYAGAPLVVIDGSASSGGHRLLRIDAPNTVVRGLAFVGWGGTAVQINGAGSIFAGNYVGVLPDGVTGKENFGAIAIEGDNVRIGGMSPGDRNVISGGFYFTLGVFGGTGARILGNHIGTNAAGTAALDSSAAAVSVSGGENITIGEPGAGNLISGNSTGIYVETAGGAPVVRIRANRIGTNAAGTGGIPNGVGVRFDGGLFGSDPGPVAPGTIVGGLGPGTGNVIAFNNVGVSVVGDPTDVPIRGNSILANTGLGIDLQNDGVSLNDALDADDGGNGLQNFPQVASVRKGPGGTTIRGTLASSPNRAYRIDLYGNPACDPSGFGEGKKLLGSVNVTTNAQGRAAFSKTVAATSPGFVSATATNPDGATSEFSLCFPKPAYVVDSAADDADADTDDYACRTAGGKCTLRAAIEQANARPGRDRIRFAIPGPGVKTIEPQSALPDVTEALVLTGPGRPGRKPRVVLDGSDAGTGADGLRAVGGPLVLQRLGVTRFDGAGVAVISGRGSAIQGNWIRSNGGLGIDLGDDGVTLNDPRDRDGGPNGRQNYPVLSGARSNGRTVTISGMLASRPGRTYRIEFFASPSCDPARVGEGATYLGATTAKTSSAGSTAFSKALAKRVPAGHVVAATATGRDGTSEFSVCRTVRR